MARAPRSRPVAARAPATPVLVALGCLVALVALAGCSSSSDPTTSRSATPTPVSQLNTAVMRLPRASFCTSLPQAAVDDAVGGRAGRGEAWRNGDKAEVEGGPRAVDDVLHEFGCRWTRDTAAARAWVFARAVTTEQADAVIAKTSKRRGCTSSAGPGFGSPSQRQTCTMSDGAIRVRLAGLFDDTWLSCEVTDGPGVSATAVSRRTDAWCVQVATAINTTR